jgi:aminoglycoside 6-adenylyltransferase
MNTANDLLSNVIQWAKEEERVRALVLVGSRAQSQGTDDLADFDIRIFTQNYEPYIHDDQWLSRFGKVWLSIPEQYDEADEVVPTRLVIYEDGIKVDFALYTMALLPKMRWIGGYRVLLDKEDVSAQIKNVLPDETRVPNEEEFVSVCKEFWFEAYHVAKYLKRNELWLVKFRDWSAKTFLLRMIEWNEQGRHNWNYQTYWMGTKMHEWMSPEIWENLHHTFAHFDRNDSWEALLKTIELFRTVALQIAPRMNFAYPKDVDENITGFILQLQKSTD